MTRTMQLCLASVTFMGLVTACGDKGSDANGKSDAKEKSDGKEKSDAKERKSTDLHGTWTIDIEKTREKTIQEMSADPDFKGMSKEEQDGMIQATLDMLKDTKHEFAEGKFDGKECKFASTSGTKWTFEVDGNKKEVHWVDDDHVRLVDVIQPGMGIDWWLVRKK